MSTIYVSDNGAELKKTGVSLQINNVDGETSLVPVKDIDNLVIFGNVRFTAPLLTSLMYNGVNVAFLTDDGHRKGYITSVAGKNSLLRLDQYKLYTDSNKRLALAKSIVHAKLKNSITVVRRFLKNHPSEEVKGYLQSIMQMNNKVESVSDAETLRGFEGMGAKNYFKCFGYMCNGDIEFVGRKYRPAPDPINALLSFGYSTLTNELFSLTDTLGFDSYIGFYHTVEFGKPSLVLDFIEEFRQSIIDRLVLTLVNKRVISSKDFYIAPNGACYFRKDMIPLFLANYEEFMTCERKYGDKKTSYRKIILSQLYQMKKVIQGDLDEYKPYILEF